MSVWAILQARVSSSRLPGKVLMPILGEPMLFRQIERIRRAKRIDRLVVATSTDGSDDPIQELCFHSGVDCFRGSLDNVLDRFYKAVQSANAEQIVRLTGDCPLCDSEVIDAVISHHIAGHYDYTTNVNPPTYPDGLDVEVMRYPVLETAWKEANLPSEREHVTLFIRNHAERFRLGNLVNRDGDLSALRWTVDEPLDFELITRIFESIYPNNKAFSTTDILALLERHPDLKTLNSQYARNEGLTRSLELERNFRSHAAPGA